MSNELYIHYSWPSSNDQILDTNKGALALLREYRQSLYKNIKTKATETRALKFIENFANFLGVNTTEMKQIESTWDSEQWDKILKQVGTELAEYCYSFTGEDKAQKPLWTEAQKNTFFKIIESENVEKIGNDYDTFFQEYNKKKSKFLNTINFLKRKELQLEIIQKKITLAIQQLNSIIEEFQKYNKTLRTVEIFFDKEAENKVKTILESIHIGLNAMNENKTLPKNFNLEKIDEQLKQCEKYIFNVASGSAFMGMLGEISLGQYIEQGKQLKATKAVIETINSVVIGASRGKGSASNIKKALNKLAPKNGINKKSLNTLLGTCTISGTQDKIDLLYYQDKRKQEGVSLKTYNLSENGTTIKVHENISLWNILLWSSQDNVTILEKYLNFFGSHDKEQKNQNLIKQRELACNELKVIMVYSGLVQGNLLKENTSPATVFLVLDPFKKRFYAYTISSLLPDIDNQSKIQKHQDKIAKISPDRLLPSQLENLNRWVGSNNFNKQAASDRVVKYLMDLHNLKFNVTVRV